MKRPSFGTDSDSEEDINDKAAQVQQVVMTNRGQKVVSGLVQCVTVLSAASTSNCQEVLFSMASRSKERLAEAAKHADSMGVDLDVGELRWCSWWSEQQPRPSV